MGPNFYQLLYDPKPSFRYILEMVFEKIPLLYTPISAQNGHFWSPEELFLAKNMEKQGVFFSMVLPKVQEP